MRVFFCLLISAFFIAQSAAQEQSFRCWAVNTDPCTDFRYWYQYIHQYSQTGQLPTDSLAPGEYTITFLLVIDKEGKVNVRTVMNDPGFGIGAKLKQVLEEYPHRWQPAEQNGRKVKYYFKQPVTLIIGEEKKCSGSTAALML